jgi:hypothetical protein
MTDCQSYAGGVCASSGLKILVPDAAEPGLIAHYSFDDDRAADSSGHGTRTTELPESERRDQPGPLTPPTHTVHIAHAAAHAAARHPTPAPTCLHL